MFPSRDITKAEVICEYEGEHISPEEAKIREKKYVEEGKPCVLTVIQSARQQIVWASIFQ